MDCIKRSRTTTLQTHRHHTCHPHAPPPAPPPPPRRPPPPPHRSPHRHQTRPRRPSDHVVDVTWNDFQWHTVYRNQDQNATDCPLKKSKKPPLPRQRPSPRLRI